MREIWGRYKFEILVFATIAVAVFAIYWPTLKNGFVYDDTSVIVNNPQIASLSNWSKAFTSCIWEQYSGGTCYEHSKYYRPLQTLSFMFTYAISSQPLVFHLVNIIYYIVLNFLVFLFLYKLFKNQLAAVLGTALFLFYPIHAEPVMWISSLSELLMGIFVVLALLAHISDWRGKNWWSAGFFFMALLAKETAIVIPLVLILYDYFWEDRKINKETLGRYIPHAIFLTYYLILRVLAIGLADVSPYPYHLSILTKLAAVMAGFGDYVLNMFNLYPSGPLTEIILTKQALITGGLLLVVFLTIFSFAVYKKNRMLVFGLGIYGLFLSPPLAALLITYLRSELIVADRYLFIPTLGVAIIFGYYCAILLKKSPRVVAVLAVVLLIIGGWYAIKAVRAQNSLWETDRRLFEYVHNSNVERGTVAVQTDLVLAMNYGTEGNLSRAIELDRAIISRADAFPVVASLAAVHLGNIYYKDYKDTAKASDYFKKALEIYPDSTVAKHNLDVLSGKVPAKQAR